MTSKHDYSHKLKGHHHSDDTIISTDISIRSLLNSVKKEVKVPSHKNTLKETIHCDLVMRCMVLMG
jgi:hypothetical protein